jgi:hypothetical protein
MEDIENIILEINKTNNWENKIALIKNAKDMIKQESDKLDNLIETLDITKKVSLKKTNFDELTNEFEKTENIDNKIRIYQILNSYIVKLSNELFDKD